MTWLPKQHAFNAKRKEALHNLLLQTGRIPQLWLKLGWC